MSKQEEIREGILNWLLGYTNLSQSKASTEADRILRKLHSQGVVIKVDRELPRYTTGYCDYEKDADGEINMTRPVFHYQKNKFTDNQKQALEEAGYVAVEPLIKEVSSG